MDVVNSSQRDGGRSGGHANAKGRRCGTTLHMGNVVDDFDSLLLHLNSTNNTNYIISTKLCFLIIIFKISIYLLGYCAQRLLPEN